jgi:S1-C subfamily serine protease/pSer/pThr/pTyr-binding forkhead associated (FHA) protein
VKAQFRILGGLRAGQSETVAKSYIAVGRHPLSDLRFDAEGDLDVSTRHAQMMWKDGRYVLRDLESKNGTYVNGKRIAGDQPLKDGDVIQFGADGPSVEYHVIVEAGDAVAMPRTTGGSGGGPQVLQARGSLGGAGSPAPEPPRGPRTSMTSRIAFEVAKQTAQLRRTTKVLLVGLVLVTGVFLFLQWRGDRTRTELLGQLQLVEDSNRAVVQQLQGQMQGLAQALTRAQNQADQLRTQLEEGGGDPTTMRQRIQELEDFQRRLRAAASVDFRQISEANQNAIVLLVIEFSANERFTGTGFAIDSQGTVITNKHVLTGERFDRRPTRIAVKFRGSRQWFQGQFVGVAANADVGVLRVTIRGGTPRVIGFAETTSEPRRGDPVAIMGFPLGFDLPMEGQGLDAIAEPSLTAGTVSKVIPNLIQVDGWGAPGSSGSPLFDREGRVIGVLYGGAPGTEGRVIFAAPVSTVKATLNSLGLR